MPSHMGCFAEIETKKAALAAAQARIAALEGALRGLRRWPDNCWCGPERSESNGKHPPACEAARALLAQSRPDWRTP